MLSATASYNDNTATLSGMFASEHHEGPSILDAMRAAGHAFLRGAKAVGRKRVLWAAMAAGAVLGVPYAAKAQNTFPSTGNVGIGTTSPTYPLQVVGQAQISAGTYPVFNVVRTTSATTNLLTTINVQTTSSGTMGNGFGDVISFGVADITGTYQLGAIGMLTDGANNSGAMVFYTENSGTDVERMRITNNGNVGIGTASPDALLSMSGNGNTQAFLHMTDTLSGGGSFYVAPHMGALGNWGLYDANAGAVRFVVNPYGSFGIGTTSPSHTLDVNGSVGAASYNSFSDARLKTDITALSYGLNAVMRLHPVGFNWKDQDQEWKKQHQIGLIAQEVETVVPEVVTTADDQMQTKSIAYGSLVPVLIQALQEEQQEITELKQVLCQSKKVAKTTSVCSKPSQSAGAKAAMIHPAP